MKMFRAALMTAVAAVSLGAASSAQADQYQPCNDTSPVATPAIRFRLVNFAGVGPSCATKPIDAPECFQVPPPGLCELSANAIATGIGGAGVSYQVQAENKQGAWVPLDSVFLLENSGGKCTVGGRVGDAGQPLACKAPPYVVSFSLGSGSLLFSVFRVVCGWQAPGLMASFSTAIQCNLNVASPHLGS